MAGVVQSDSDDRNTTSWQPPELCEFSWTRTSIGAWAEYCPATRWSPEIDGTASHTYAQTCANNGDSRLRTTVILDDDLVRRAKQRAAGRNVSLSALINDALRAALAPRAAEVSRFSLPTHGDPRRKQHLTPAQVAEAAEQDDVRSLR